MDVTFGITEYLTIFAIVTFIAVMFSPGRKRYKNLPPGPRGVPLFGNVFQLTSRPNLVMSEWAKKYGPIYSMQLVNKRGIVISEHKVIKEILCDPNFAVRPEIEVLDLFNGGHTGIFFTNGTQWDEQRRWVMKKLNDYGMGNKTAMEGIMMDEINELCEYFVKLQGAAVVIKERFNIAVLNSLWTILNGDRMSQDDPKMRKIVEAFDAVTPAIATSGLIFAPWLKYFNLGGYRTIVKAADEVMSYARAAVSYHFDTHKDGISRDFIDEYIEEIKSTKDPRSSFYKDAGRKNLEGLVSELIQAGSETSSNTLSWAIAYVAHWPETQKRVHAELDRVVGNRTVKLSDKYSLPYTEAIIWETLRKSAIVAAGATREAAEDKVVQGYMIPKGTWVLTNVYWAHNDPAVWGDPENFRPERFLSPDGTKVVKNERVIPFQMGKRKCPGETFARDTLFLFVANILQKFEITMVEKEEPKPEKGFFLFLQPYSFIFKVREGQN